MATSEEVVDELLKNYQKPEDIIGENGLLKQLTKALLERAFNASFMVTLNPKDFPQERIRAKVIAPGTPVPSTAPGRLVKPKKSRGRIS